MKSVDGSEFEIKGIPFECKFVSESSPGEFEGYGAVYGNLDSHEDVILPKSFDVSLAQHKAAGTMPAMHIEHNWASMFGGGDPLPAGVWTEMADDGKGLRVKGKISALDTDYGRRVHSLMKDGALKGLSIGFRVMPGGSERPKSKDGPKRLLKALDLISVDIVKFPSNALARVDALKSLMRNADAQGAADSCAAAIGLHRTTMSGNDAPTVDERAQMLTHLQDAHEALTGYRMPKGMKSVAPSTIRELEAAFREIGLSNSRARALAEYALKTTPRDEAEGQANIAVKDVVDDLATSLRGFTLPKFSK